MELCKVTTCDDTTLSYLRPRYPTTKIIQLHSWLSADVQARIEPPPIPLIKVELEEERTSKIIRVKIRINPDSSMSETYEFKMARLKNGQPEDFLRPMKNFNIAINGRGTKSDSGQINYIRTMLCTMLSGDALREFDVLYSQNNGTENDHLKHIMEGLLGYLPPINVLSNQKCAMCRAMRKY